MNFDKYGIPLRMQGGLERYIFYRVLPGSFLTAVLRNDLRSACECADDENKYLLPNYVTFLVNEAPYNCWGSLEVVKEWLPSGS